jgi:hypothetical protein
MLKPLFLQAWPIDYLKEFLTFGITQYGSNLMRRPVFSAVCADALDVLEKLVIFHKVDELS